MCVYSMLLSLLFARGAFGGQDADLEAWSLGQLEQRLAEIDTELESLAAYRFRGGVGSIGYQSYMHNQPAGREWVRIDLAQPVLVDQIILVPTLSRDTKEGLKSEGFPVCFEVLAGEGQTTNLVASFTEKDGLLPRIAPLAVPFDPVKASWVSVNATKLSERSLHEVSLFALQLSEILVFSGLENVALKQPVSASSSKTKFLSREAGYLTDGFVPYRMQAAHGTPSRPVVFSSKEPFLHASLTIDLQESFPVNRVYLHALDTFLSIPEDGGGSAIPPHIRVLGANQPDFSDKTLLLEFQQTSAYDVGPIMLHRFPEKSCRYVRFELLEFEKHEYRDGIGFFAGFSEIEVLSKGRNVALGKPVSGTNLLGKYNLALLTDGNNYLGKVLPLRTWMNQLAKRHELEKERPMVAAELNLRYARQKRNLNFMYWLATLLGLGTVIILLLERTIRQHTVFKTRERIAANLHDELGANLHALVLYSDLADEEIHDGEGGEKWSRLAEYVGKIRTITECSAKSARFCTNMLEAKELYENPADEMRRIAKRTLTDMEHDISFTGQEALRALSPRRRVDLILFYKECLTNMILHSGATRAETRLTADSKKVVLTVQDNGKGVNTTPPSLKRRARLLKARLSVDSSDQGGTKTTLFLKFPRVFIRKAGL